MVRGYGQCGIGGSIASEDAGVNGLMMSAVRGFGSRMGVAGLMVATICLVGVVAAPAALGQSARRTRRESNANRKARVERTIADTYGNRWEVGGGGGVLRWHSGPYKKQNNDVTFWSSAMYSLTPKLGVEGLLGGAFGSARLGNTVQNATNPQIQTYDFMVGPSYRFRAKEKYSVSGYAAGGAAWGRFSTGPKDYLPEIVGLWPSGVRGAFGVGVNLDYNVDTKLSLRITPNYLGTTFGGTVQNNKGVNVGVVYRFGKVK